MVKFLIIGDLHGNIPKINYKDIDAIIAPGDFCSDNPRKYMFEAMRKNLQDSNYKSEWYDIVGKAKAKKMLKKSLKDGRKILEFLNSLNVPVFALPGNWDWTGGKYDWKHLKGNFWKKYLIKDLKNIKDCHKKSRIFKGIKIIGHGITGGPEYPVKETEKFNKKVLAKQKKNYPKLLKQMSSKFKKSKQPTILLSHNVPYNTKLDKINNPSSPMHGKHMGSTLARDLILKHSPLACIGGHIHETFGKTRLKKTICINAGFGSHVNTFLEIKDGKIKKIEFKEKGKIIS